MSPLRGKDIGIESSWTCRERKERIENKIGTENQQELRREENEEGKGEKQARKGREKHMAGINYLPFMYNKKMHFNYRKSTKSTQ